MSTPLVGIIMGSESDLVIMNAAAEVLKKFGIAYEIDIVSAHRTPEKCTLMLKMLRGAD